MPIHAQSAGSPWTVRPGRTAVIDTQPTPAVLFTDFIRQFSAGFDSGLAFLSISIYYTLSFLSTVER